MILEVAVLDVIPGQELSFQQDFSKAQKIISSMPGYIIARPDYGSSRHFQSRNKLRCSLTNLEVAMLCQSQGSDWGASFGYQTLEPTLGVPDLRAEYPQVLPDHHCRHFY